MHKALALIAIVNSSSPLFAATSPVVNEKVIQLSQRDSAHCKALADKIDKVAGKTSDEERPVFSAKEKTLAAAREIKNYKGVSPVISKAIESIGKLTELDDANFAALNKIEGCEPIRFFRIHKGLIYGAKKYSLEGNDLADIKMILRDYVLGESYAGGMFISTTLAVGVATMAAEEGLLSFTPEEMTELKKLRADMNKLVEAKPAALEEIRATQVFRARLAEIVKQLR